MVIVQYLTTDWKHDGTNIGFVEAIDTNEWNEEEADYWLVTNMHGSECRMIIPDQPIIQSGWVPVLLRSNFDA
jgi:RNA polymerase-interacting CarD/CdnL/TRCF family regulator